jgi:ATP-dependent Clp protease ATP-binding subunit ClpX
MESESTIVFEANCSFCRKNHKDVETLIGAIGVFICNECVDVANDTLAKVRAARDPNAPTPAFDYPAQLRGAASEKLLRLVAGVEPLRQDVAAYQALNVDILRERGVSWAEIGGALGVSRQAAWKRFAKGPEID